MGPDDGRCLKCILEKRGCSFVKKEGKEVKKETEEREPKTSVKRPRRGTVRKDPDASASAAAGPSSRPVAIRERESSFLCAYVRVW